MTEKNEQKVELAACPMCAATASTIRDGNVFAGQDYGSRYPEGVRTQMHGWQVRCDRCGIQTCWWHYEAEAIAAWNRRTPPLDALRALEGNEGAVERVAKALALCDSWEKWDNAADFNDTPSGTDPEECRDGYRDMARAALKAMGGEK